MTRDNEGAPTAKYRAPVMQGKWPWQDIGIILLDPRMRKELALLVAVFALPVAVIYVAGAARAAGWW